MFCNKYPHTDFHELNLDWILAEIMKLHHDYDEFKAINTITNDGAWDITKQYQAWTVVSDNNIGYISLKPVPAGVAITNTEYWGVIADYDILITDLSNRISTLEGQMATLNNTTIPVINLELADHEERLSLLDHRKYIFIGDSYAVRTDNWVDELVTMLGLSASDYYTSAAASYGFRGDPNVPHTQFINLLDALDSVIDDKDEITDIVVAGGINDNYSPYDAGTLIAYGDAFCADALTKYQNAKIHIAFIGYSKNVTYLENFPQTIRNYMEIAENENCVFVDNVWNAFHYVPWLDDDVHPNASGMKAIANMLKNHLLGAGNGNGIPSQVPVNVTITPSGILSGYNKYTGTIANELFDGKDVTLTILTFVVGTTGFSHTFDETLYELATITGGYLTGIGDIYTAAHVTAYDATQQKVHSIPASITVRDGKIYMMASHKDNMSTTDLTLSNITQFVIKPVSLTFNGINS